MVFDLYFPLFAILAAYLIVGAITSVAGAILCSVHQAPADRSRMK
jgi:hypothetical protein